SDYAKGACWSWKGQVQRLSHVIEWTVTGVPGDSLSLPLALLNGAYGGTVPELYPIDGKVEMQVWHAPHAELPPDSVVPPEPSRGVAAMHFSGFDALLQAPIDGVPAYEPAACPAIENPGKYDSDRGAATYTCVSGEGGH
ncbi:MAG: hypothetical protein JO306_14080, partial [Gemmatimonadetes bacterium]|nr:hypothetical protein [Gemmatimonadota bacterium]